MHNFFSLFFLFSTFSLFCFNHQSGRPPSMQGFGIPPAVLLSMMTQGMMPALPFFMMRRSEDEDDKKFKQAHNQMVATVRRRVDTHTLLAQGDVKAIIAEFHKISPVTEIAEGTVYCQARDYATNCVVKAKKKATGEDGSDEKMNAAQVKSEEEKELKFRQQVKWYDGQNEAFMEARKSKKKS